MIHEEEQAHNKLNIFLRNSRIRAYHDTMVLQGNTSIDAIKVLAKKTYETWKGEKYFLGIKAISAIVQQNGD